MDPWMMMGWDGMDRGKSIKSLGGRSGRVSSDVELFPFKEIG